MTLPRPRTASAWGVSRATKPKDSWPTPLPPPFLSPGRSPRHKQSRTMASLHWAQACPAHACHPHAELPRAVRVSCPCPLMTWDKVPSPPPLSCMVPKQQHFQEFWGDSSPTAQDPIPPGSPGWGLCPQRHVSPRLRRQGCACHRPLPEKNVSCRRPLHTQADGPGGLGPHPPDGTPRGGQRAAQAETMQGVTQDRASPISQQVSLPSDPAASKSDAAAGVLA